MSDAANAIVERLARLTPSAAGLHRDALFFQAGCAAARPHRWWPRVAGALALAQCLLLALWILRPESAPAPVHVGPPAPVAPRPQDPSPTIDRDWWTARRGGVLPERATPSIESPAPTEPSTMWSIRSELPEY